MSSEVIRLDGVIDLHTHGGPDVRPRKMTGLELARAAQQAGMRGFLFKNHHAPTVAPAALLREAVPGLEVFGGLALNDSVSGMREMLQQLAARGFTRAELAVMTCRNPSRLLGLNERA